MTTIVNNYHVRIADKKTRINELIEESVYDIQGVKHIDLNDFAYQLVIETINMVEEAQDSGFNPDVYTLAHLGLE